MGKTKVVVIGTGMIAKEHLKCLKKLSNVEVVGVCDLSPAKAEATSERFKIPKWGTNFQELITAVKPDIAHVTTNGPSHFTIAKELLTSGVSVFVEKPITASYSEFQTLKSIAEKNSLILLEDHNYQFNPPIQETLKLIQSGDFGGVQHVEMSLCVEKGIISDFLTHLANLTYIFLGAHTDIYTLWRKEKGEFRTLVETPQGTASIAFSGNAQPDGFWVSVYGTKMRASMNLFELRLILEKTRNLPRPLMHFANGMLASSSDFKATFKSLWSKLKGNPGGYSGLNVLLKRTYEAIEAKKPLPIALEQIDAVNRLVADMKSGGI